MFEIQEMRRKEKKRQKHKSRQKGAHKNCHLECCSLHVDQVCRARFSIWGLLAHELATQGQ